MWTVDRATGKTVPADLPGDVGAQGGDCIEVTERHRASLMEINAPPPPPGGGGAAGPGCERDGEGAGPAGGAGVSDSEVVLAAGGTLFWGTLGATAAHPGSLGAYEPS
ncbi:MAG: hypothetical protein R3B70_25610 [Polyangiaceae bacterium]